MTDLDQKLERVQEKHRDRLDGPLAEKLVSRPFKRRKRPRTAIISEAAKRAIEDREMAERFWEAVRTGCTDA